MPTLSIGIMAYNEEANIGRLLSSLLDQNLTQANLTEIFVVASGCTDRTEKIVDIYKKEILATNGKIHKEMLSLLDLT